MSCSCALAHPAPIACTVTAITRPAGDIIDLRLSARGPGIEVTPGQFVFLYIRGGTGWREHPFSVAGTSADRQLRLTIRVAGRDTARLPNLHVHPVFSRTDGRLTAATIAQSAAGLTPETHVFLCGPPGLIEDLRRGFRQRGVPLARLHAEHFAFR